MSSIEKTEDAQLEAFAEQHFPGVMDQVGRRRFMQLMGASMGLAGAACTRQPLEHIVPYVTRPEEIIPGRPLTFATTLPHLGFGMGALVESHTGRPTKVEGNPLHPASLGSTDAIMQAEVLGLYDPDRSKSTQHRGHVSSYNAFKTALRDFLDNRADADGANIALLLAPSTSPTRARLLGELGRRFPAAGIFIDDAVMPRYAHRGSTLSRGRALDIAARLDRAKVILALDADFLGAGPAKVRYARDFADGRSAKNMNRLYVAEAQSSLTGAAADHRLAVRGSDIGAIAHAVATALGVPGLPKGPTGLGAETASWAGIVAEDLRAAGPSALVMAGPGQPPAVHGLVHAMLEHLGAVGTSCWLLDPPTGAAGAGLAEFTQALSRCDLALFAGVNPCYDAPQAAHIQTALERPAMSVHLGSHIDETAQRCRWHIPEAHPLEAWGDLRAYDGTASLTQPLVAPLYRGRQLEELLALLVGLPEADPRKLVQETWARRGYDGRAYRRLLHDGVVSGTASPRIAAPLLPEWGQAIDHTHWGDRSQGLEVGFHLDPHVLDGRYANNAWLQELPKPITRLTWDNAVLLSPATAARLSVRNQDRVNLVTADAKASVEGTAWVVPGQADESVTVHLGYGRRAGGKVAVGAGFNASLLRDATNLGWTMVDLKATGDRGLLATTQEHHRMEGREPVRLASVAGFLQDPEGTFHRSHDDAEQHSLYPRHEYKDHAWGMAIDLTRCIGCGACTMACQAENNIAVVGRDEVARGREMHWIRVDHYHVGDDLAAPTSVHQPIPCMHCENAPCELVCPTSATVHSDEGLNDMVYNRCVGTRYCANNCPYKVRRFNFYLYSDFQTESLKGARNPDVTVRSRGVMEKCTYCVQRINAARIDARKEGRAIADGEVTTACEAACPTRAITFGDINDPQSRVALAKADTRNYNLLGELGVRPRTTYLGRLVNPNPKLSA